MVGGETAEMPGMYTANGMDIAGFTVGVLEDELYPKIELVSEGCDIYGIPSSGIHSNGFSLVRKLLKYHDYDYNILMKPTKIYMECLDIIQKYKGQLLGMAHITGGGLIENIKRIIPVTNDIIIDVPIENEFQWIMEKSGMSYDDMIRTFNCGYGIALIFKKGFRCFDYDKIGKIV